MAIAEQEVGILYTCQTGVYQVTHACCIHRILFCMRICAPTHTWLIVAHYSNQKTLKYLCCRVQLFWMILYICGMVCPRAHMISHMMRHVCCNIHLTAIISSRFFLILITSRYSRCCRWSACLQVNELSCHPQRATIASIPVLFPHFDTVIFVCCETNLHTCMHMRVAAVMWSAWSCCGLCSNRFDMTVEQVRWDCCTHEILSLVGFWGRTVCVNLPKPRTLVENTQIAETFNKQKRKHDDEESKNQLSEGEADEDGSDEGELNESKVQTLRHCCIYNIFMLWDVLFKEYQPTHVHLGACANMITQFVEITSHRFS